MKASRAEWVVFVDVDAVQPYLLSSVRLREIAGASQLLVEHDDAIRALARRHGGDPVFSAGGTAVVTFPVVDGGNGRAHAHDASKNFTEAAGERLRALTVSATLTASAPVFSESDALFGTALAAAIQDVQRQKREGHATGELLDFAFARRCESCGLEPVITAGTVEVGSDSRRLGAACHRKREAWDRAHWVERLRHEPGWSDVTRAALAVDIDELVDSERLAIVAADVNGVGDRLRGITRKDAYERFSRGLREAVEASLYEAIATTVKRANYTKLPVAILYLGGDDVLLACRARLALPLATHHSCPNCVSAKAQLGQHPKPSPQGDRSPRPWDARFCRRNDDLPMSWRCETPASQFGQHHAGPGDLDRKSRPSSSDFKGLPRPRITSQS